MQIQPIPALADNYIWRIASKGNAVLVDPGEAAPALAHLAQEKLKLTAILITHRHGDHIAGVPELAQNGCPIYGPKEIACVTHPVQDEDRFIPAGLEEEARVTALPGHVDELIAYQINEHCFSSDILFSAGCGRVFDGDPNALFHSLQKLMTLPENTLFYGTHEYTLSNLRFAEFLEPDNLDIQTYRDRVIALRAQGIPTLPIQKELELRVNPFLRDNSTLRQKAAAYIGHSINDHESLFVALREWKNHF